MNDYTREHVDEGILLRYVDGELDEMDVELVEDHITACEKCRDRYDDLAAASDSLTAFLRKSDYPDRALAYRPRGVGGAWWAHPLARAAALALLLGGLVAPVTFLMLRGSAGDESVSFAFVPPRPAAGTGSTRSVAAPPADGKPMADELEAFTIDLSSWQAGGVLKLFFTDGDMFNYSGRNANNTAASFNTMTNQAHIRTTANSEADHEIWIPRYYDPENILVRIAGRPVSFEVSIPVGSIMLPPPSRTAARSTFHGVATIQLSR